MDAERESQRLFIRLGVMVSMAYQGGVDHLDFCAALDAAGYPRETITEDFAREWSAKLRARLIVCGVIGADEDPLDTMLAEHAEEGR